MTQVGTPGWCDTQFQDWSQAGAASQKAQIDVMEASFALEEAVYAGDPGTCLEALQLCQQWLGRLASGWQLVGAAGLQESALCAYSQVGYWISDQASWQNGLAAFQAQQLFPFFGVLRDLNQSAQYQGELPGIMAWWGIVLVAGCMFGLEALREHQEAKGHPVRAIQSRPLVEARR